MSDVVAAASSWLAEKVWWTILGLIVVTALLLPRKKISLLGMVMWVVAVAVILGLAVGLRSSGLVGPGTERPGFTIPYGDVSQLSESLRTEVRNYVGRLHFDTAEHGVIARNLLDTLGTVGTIIPERNAHHTDIRQIKREGRIHLRIGISGDSAYGYLPAGVSYVWVDSVEMQGGTGTARAVIIPEDPKGAVRSVSMAVYRDPRRYWWTKALARWKWDLPGDGVQQSQTQTPRIDANCYTCDPHGWCEMK
jgi:hypothetical protein